MCYFDHGERHWHEQPLCALKAQASTPVQQCTFACNERPGVGESWWVSLYYRWGFWGLKLFQIFYYGCRRQLCLGVFIKARIVCEIVKIDVDIDLVPIIS